MTIERDIDLGGGRTLHTYDTAVGDLAVLWHHGTPNIGDPPRPLFEVARRVGVRWVSYDRPSYGGSTPRRGRTVGDAAGYAEAVADALGIERFAVMGHSGGSSFALATAALLGDRVQAVASISAVAPYDGTDAWYAGMAPSSEGSLRAASRGRAAKEAYEAADHDLPPGFIDKDNAMFDGEWAWLLDVVRPALAQGVEGLIDDDLAYVTPWGADPSAITAPVLLMHGRADILVPAAHSERLAATVKHADLRLYDGDGHISVLTHAADAVRWLVQR